MAVINKLGNVTYNPAQLARLAQNLIASKWSKEQEANIQRKIQGISLGMYTPTAQEQADIDRYKADLMQVQADIAQAEIDNQDLINVIKHEKAKERLAQYKLEVGKPSVPIYDTQIDPKTGKQVQVKIGMTQEILPLNLLVTETTTDPLTNKTTSKQVTNPLILKDRAERASADAIVKSATPKILGDFALRNR